MYTLELARANADELLREARKSRAHTRGTLADAAADASRYAALRRLTR